MASLPRLEARRRTPPDDDRERRVREALRALLEEDDRETRINPNYRPWEVEPWPAA